MAVVKNKFTDAGNTDIIEDLASDLIDKAFGALSPLNNVGRYITGSRAIIKINDKLAGFAFKCSYRIDTTQDEITTIDDYTPWEIAPKRVSVSGSMSMFHIPNKGPAKELIQANVLSFMHHKYITIELRDQTTDALIFKTNKAVITNKQQVLQAGEISTIDLQWKAIGWIDEMQPSIPNSQT